jgi:histidine triad (HIT) family protein
MKTWPVFVALAVGLLVGELDPFGAMGWRVLEARLPAMKEDSLAAPSPFDRLPSSRWLAQSENAFVLENDVAPIAPVHLLVIPKRRYPSLLEAPAELLGEMLDLARRMAIERGIAEDGFRVIVNKNPGGGQTVYHLHMHVLGGRQLHWPLLPEIRGRLMQRLRTFGSRSRARPADPPA